MPLPYAFILLRTADLRLGPADRTVLQFLLLQGGKASQIVVGRIGRDCIGASRPPKPSGYAPPSSPEPLSSATAGSGFVA